MRKHVFTIIIFFLGLSALAQQTHEVSLVSLMNGQKTLIDGQEIEFWGYGLDDPLSNNDKIFLPGPVLRFDQEDTVIINLTNNSPEDHTIHWHGLDVDQENDGVPTTSPGGAVNGGGGQFTYTFVCKEPGSFIYHCHVLTTLHLAMGMYGMFIIDPAEENQIYSSVGKYTKEYNYLFSDMYTQWNVNPLSPGPFYLYDPDYAMVNGWAGYEIEDKNQSIEGTHLDSIGLRLANTGYGRVEVIFPQGLTAKVYGSDGREVNEFTTDTLNLHPGERFGVVGYPQGAIDDSITVNYYDLRNDNLYYTNYIPVRISDVTSLNGESAIELSIYPNPFSQDVIIDGVESEGNALLLDLNGKIVWKGRLSKGKNKLHLSLDSGIYILQHQSQQFKLIKQ